MTPNLPIGQCLTIEIPKVEVQGRGIFRHEGVVGFVDAVAPGDLVEVEIVAQKKRFFLASLKRLLKGSLHRVKPSCPHFKECGGCQLQHLTQSLQTELKTEHITERLESLTHRTLATKVLPALETVSLGYRNKMQFVVGPDRKLGLYRQRSHNFLPIDRCLLALPELQLLAKKVEKALSLTSWSHYDEKKHQGSLRNVVLRWSHHEQKALVVIVSLNRNLRDFKPWASSLMSLEDQIGGVILHHNPKKGNFVFSGENRLTVGRSTLREEVEGHFLEYGPTSFFQVNLEGLKVIVKLVKKALDSLEGPLYLLDFYCGVGLFSIALSPLLEASLGIESWPAAVEHAERNARLNQLQEKARFVCLPSEDFAQEKGASWDTSYPWNVALLDPPRKGCDFEVLKKIFLAGIPNIVYVSCSPASLARDVKHLQEWGYEVCWAQGVEMFSQTSHVETVCFLRKQEVAR